MTLAVIVLVAAIVVMAVWYHVKARFGFGVGADGLAATVVVTRVFKWWLDRRDRRGSL